MSSINEDGGLAPTQTATEHDSWSDFEVRLGMFLAQMTDSAEQDHLLIEMPDDPDSESVAPYAQFAGFGDGEWVRAEIAGGSYLSEQWQLSAEGEEFLRGAGWSGNDRECPNWFYEASIDQVHDVAAEVATALSEFFGISEPGLLTYRAWGPAERFADLLGLSASDEIPVDTPQKPFNNAGIDGPILESTGVFPRDRDHLTQLVGATLEAKFEQTVVPDDDGDYPFHVGERFLWVHICEDQPALQITALLVQDVGSRRAAGVETSLLNRDHMWSRWVLRDRNIWQFCSVPAGPFVPHHLSVMLDLFVGAMNEQTEDLALRVRGKVA